MYGEGLTDEFIDIDNYYGYTGVTGSMNNVFFVRQENNVSAVGAW